MGYKKTALEKECFKLAKKEQAYLQKRMQKKDSKLNQFLENKVPAGLQSKLDGAFFKAFQLVFEKGTGVIEKTYNRDELQKTYSINEYAAEVRNNSKSLKTFSKKAATAGGINLVLSGASGIGLGVLGIGLPDIALFTGFMLKSLYEIALDFGFDYKDEEEKRFILLLIRGALSYGEELKSIDDEINFYIDYGTFGKPAEIDACIKDAAGCLSKELLYMKFLQGIPIVGVVGGAYDAVYMKKIVEYAEMKYRRRFYSKRQ